LLVVAHCCSVSQSHTKAMWSATSLVVPRRRCHSEGRSQRVDCAGKPGL
jgi:hypothetical protein